jgi:hypothetical protein
MNRVVDVLIGLASVLAAIVLAVMLLDPLLARPASGAAVPTPSATAEPSATPADDGPPIGLYLLRGPFSFGHCMAMDLAATAYPVDPAAEGTATVLWWDRGMTGCDTRTGPIDDVTATVTQVRPADDEDGEVVGYAVHFALPTPDGPGVAVEITILADASTQDLVQAIESSSPGAPGLVFDRVEEVGPPEDPLPSAAP